MKTITITSPDGQASATFVPEQGGAMSSLILPGNDGPSERLFCHDYFWESPLPDLPGGSPFCFPICGRLARPDQAEVYSLQQQYYTMRIHGFAWQKAWQVDEHAEHSITLSLSDDEQTQAQYPFSFKVMLRYELHNDRIVCQQTYVNHSDQPMPYYAGFHPYFLTPDADNGKADVSIEFTPTQRFVYNGALTDIVGQQNVLTMPMSIADPQLNEQLHAVGVDKTTKLTFPNGDVLIMTAAGVDDPDLFPYVQCYTIADKPFICVEPWMSYPNAMNTLDGVRHLAPGARERGELTIQVA